MRHDWKKQSKFPIIGNLGVFYIIKCQRCKMTARKYLSEYIISPNKKTRGDLDNCKKL